MKKGFVVVLFLLSSQFISAQNEIGPEGHKLLWVFLFLVLVSIAFVLMVKPFKKRTQKEQKPFFKNRKVSIELKKDSVYYPDNLRLSVKNSGNIDLDLDQPLLVFDNFWLKRKFRIKGMENRSFYPLFLEKGKTHQLNVDLTRFYGHDKKLKKFPKAKVILFDVRGKKLASKSVFLRKTLFKF